MDRWTGEGVLRGVDRRGGPKRSGQERGVLRGVDRWTGERVLRGVDRRAGPKRSGQERGS